MGGMFGGGGDASEEAEKSNELLQKQLDEQKREEQQQLQALSQQEFNIVKSQGGLNWNAQKPTGIQPES